MAYDEGLAERLRETYADIPYVHEKKMFGGLAFMVDGNMSCGVMSDGQLMVRVGPTLYADALARPYARPMDFTGRKMTGFVIVDEQGLVEDEDLRDWVQLSLQFVQSLPPK